MSTPPPTPSQGTPTVPPNTNPDDLSWFQRKRLERQLRKQQKAQNQVNQTGTTAPSKAPYIIFTVVWFLFMWWCAYMAIPFVWARSNSGWAVVLLVLLIALFLGVLIGGIKLAWAHYNKRLAAANTPVTV